MGTIWILSNLTRNSPKPNLKYIYLYYIGIIVYYLDFFNKIWYIDIDIKYRYQEIYSINCNIYKRVDKLS